MVVLIPAKMHSQRVPLKNLRDLGGYPLVAWSIAAARSIGVIAIDISSDSAGVYDALGFTEETVRLRSKETAMSIATDRDVVLDYLSKKVEQNQTVIYLRPTTPFRDPNILMEAVKQFEFRAVLNGCGPQKNNLYSLRSMHQMVEPCGKMYTGERGDFIKPLFGTHDEANRPSQECDKTYHPNGYIDIFRTDRISEGLFLGPFHAFITPKTIDVDTEEDLEYANWWLAKHSHPLWDYMKAIWKR